MSLILRREGFRENLAGHYWEGGRKNSKQQSKLFKKAIEEKSALI